MRSQEPEISPWSACLSVCIASPRDTTPRCRHSTRLLAAPVTSRKRAPTPQRPRDPNSGPLWLEGVTSDKPPQSPIDQLARSEITSSCSFPSADTHTSRSATAAPPLGSFPGRHRHGLTHCPATRPSIGTRSQHHPPNHTITRQPTTPLLATTLLPLSPYPPPPPYFYLGLLQQRRAFRWRHL